MMMQEVEEIVAKYFETFARQRLLPGDVHTFKTSVECLTQVENQSVTGTFERDKALRHMETQGWVEMPGGRRAVLTAAGFAEMNRRYPQS